MSISTNASIAHLQLRLTPTDQPHIQRPCARCKSRQTFTSSGKFRVNANGKAIDVWLIYRCATCDQTWNHALHERRAVKSLPADELNAFMQNDAALAKRHAADVERLRAAGAVVIAAADVAIERVVLQPATMETAEIVISIALTSPCHIRLDRVLAAGLCLQRPAVVQLAEQAMIGNQMVSAKALKRAVLDGQVIRLDLTRCGGMRAAICHALSHFEVTPC
nr:DUF1062 domain-containing protein [uncultured Dongia sp.]